MDYNPSQNAPAQELPSSMAIADGHLPDDPRLIRLLQEYLEELESGRQPNRRRWLERYPDLADALGPCLEGLELVHRAAPLATPLSGNSLPTSPLGDFQTVREIGRGGMGIVYEAIQMSLGRRVALKVLPFAATFDAKHLQRFRLEAQAAAQLHHANIVPVYGVGCERGIHFYAMQLIEGQSLEMVIQQLRHDAGISTSDESTPNGHSADHASNLSNGGSASRTDAWSPAASAPKSEYPKSDVLPIAAPQADTTERQVSAHFSTYRTGKNSERYRTIARCMAEVAEALEYAHQQGIVHRDIKPANLLIDFQQKFWIADFGLAHFHDAPGLTRTGDIVGTIRYMSPEQASGQRTVLDHRTDIYSLAATFYELVTLHPVFPSKTRHGLLADVLNREPKSLRSFDRRIPAELEIIILKALSKNPFERYATAQAMASDLQRFLRDEPIRAKRPSLLEHARKWSRRHPSLLGAGLVMLCLTLVGSLIANWLITAANERTKVALAEAQLRAQEAEQRFQQARHAADLLVEVSEQEMDDKPPTRNLRKRLLETATDYYKDFVSQRRGDVSSQAELVAVRDRLKKSLDDLAVLDGAGQFILLSDRRVQSELGLSSAQRAKIEEITDDFAHSRIDFLHNFRQLPSDRQSRFIEMARANDRVMRTTLSPAQLERLEEITLQLHGTLAFGQADVVARLHLTDSQRQEIREIEKQAFEPPWDPMNPGGGHPPEDGPRNRPENASRDRIEQVRNVMAKAIAVLTADQQIEWKKLTGSPFKDVYDFLPDCHRPSHEHGHFNHDESIGVQQ